MHTNNKLQTRKQYTDTAANRRAYTENGTLTVRAYTESGTLTVRAYTESGALTVRAYAACFLKLLK